MNKYAWTEIEALKGDDDAALARHNLLATLGTAPTNRARKDLIILTAIVVAEGGEIAEPWQAKLRRKFRTLPLRSLLKKQHQAYRRASHFGFSAVNGKNLSERARQQLRDQQHDQLDIHDLVVDEISRRVALASRTTWTKQPGQSPRPTPKV